MSEVHDQLKQAVTALAKDDQEAAIKIFHDVLQAKMQARVNPSAVKPQGEETPESTVEVVPPANPDATPAAE
jgi:hypothetical protein